MPSDESFITTHVIGMLYCTAVESAWTAIMKPPSPVTATAGFSGRASLTASAAGSAHPIPAVPPGAKIDSGARLWYISDIHTRLLPASSVMSDSGSRCSWSSRTSRCGVTGDESSNIVGSV